MRKFDYKGLEEKKWDSKTLSFIARISQMQGRQELFVKQKSQELEKLVEISKIQSTEASNSIEGIRTTDTRLKQLVEEKITPKNRNEEEIAGYRDALAIIHENFDYITITPNFILQLHKILFSHCSETKSGGKFKSVQNFISSVDANGNVSTLFTPLDPFDTPMAMEKICNEFNAAIAYGKVHPLIIIPIFIHDFLCIHPFLDGNGRMSRLLTTLLLYRSGFYVGKYISLEAKIAKYKDLYYDALQDSQVGWHENKEDIMPFVRYMLSTILSAYNDFEERINIVSNNKTSISMVKDAVNKQIGKFKKVDIISLCSSLSSSSIEKALKKLQDDGMIEKYGVGKSTFYVRKN